MHIEGEGAETTYFFTDDEVVCMVKMVGVDVLKASGFEGVLSECVKQHPIGCECRNEFCVRIRSGEFR